jgi:putative acetyltransferase
MIAMIVRTEQAGDADGIRRVHQSAFPTPAESLLVDKLRAAGDLALSLVACEQDSIVGHIAFSPVKSDSGRGAGLAPVAVLPDFQRRGIGGTLIRDGLIRCTSAGFEFAVVLGDPAYYGRFGFSPASRWGLRDEYGGADAFQAIELMTGAMPASGGLVRYAPAFAMFTDG